MPALNKHFPFNVFACKQCMKEKVLVEIGLSLNLCKSFRTNRIQLKCPRCNYQAPHSSTKFSDKDQRYKHHKDLWIPFYLYYTTKKVDLDKLLDTLEVFKRASVPADEHKYVIYRQHEQDFVPQHGEDKEDYK